MSTIQNKEVRKKDLDINLLRQEILSFVDNLQSLEKSVGILMPVLEIYSREAIKKYNKSLIRYGEKKKDYFLIPPHHQSSIDKLRDKAKIIDVASIKIVPSSFLVSLVSIFDGFLSNIVKLNYRKNPKLILFNHLADNQNYSEMRHLTYEEILNHDYEDDLVSLVIDKEVDFFSHGSHLDQIEWINKRFNLDMDKKLLNLSEFIEVTERRNLFVHCNGVVSKQYLNSCKKNSYALKPEIKLGTQLDVPPEYFKNAYSIFFEAGIKLAYLSWKKLIPTELPIAEITLGEDVCFKLLKNEDYFLATKLLDFAISMEFTNDGIKKTTIINRALAYKWNGDNKTAKEIISKEDWSACNSNLKLAVEIIRDNYVGAVVLMKNIGGKSKNLTLSDYYKWPLFKEFKKSKLFLKAFKEIFKEEFGKYKGKKILQLQS